MLSSNFSAGGLEGLLIGLAVIAFFIVRQFSTRRVNNPLNLILPLALLYFGIQSLGQLDSMGWFALSASLALGIALGFARAATFRVWTDATGQSLMRGTPLTLVLWAVTFAVRLVIAVVERRAGLVGASSASAETLLPAAVTLGAQSLVVYVRARDRRLVERPSTSLG